MSFAERSAQGRFEDKFNNQIQRSISDLQETRQKKMQMDESSLVANVLKGVSQLGEDASLENVLQGIYGKGLSPQSEQNLSKQLGEHHSKKEIANAKKKEEKSSGLSPESKSRLNHAYTRTNELLKKGASGWNPLTALTPEGRKERAELDNLSEIWISELIPLLNPRGTISQSRFNYIKGLAPSSWDTDATIKGKLKALKDIFKEHGIEPGKGEGAQTPGEPNGFRSQNEKPQGEFVNAHNPKTNKKYKNIPRAEFEKMKHLSPDLQVMEMEETDRSNQ